MQGNHPEAGTMGEPCLLACSHPASLYNPGPLVSGGPVHRGLGPPTSVNNQGIPPPHLATGQSHMANPSMKTPSSPTTLGCVKLSVKTNWDVLL